ncbi:MULTISPECIES: hypothetical protein [unclassified Bradyrhizobium]|uniref:hypothetical protein n=1 Tax=unclassified Bradyrhizobium TaxID=2631580 RepID=UPI001FF94C12|nr:MULTISPECIES: hypothetical protein [unclassified Bradyrhizobium]
MNDLDRQAHWMAVRNILQHNYLPEAVNDAFYDREAQPDTIFSRSAAAEERLEYPIDVAGRGAWSGIFDLHHRFLARAVDPNVDPSARQAHGIVEQVAYHRRDHHGLALDRDWFNQLEAKIYSLARRLWHQIRHQILHGAV